MSGAGKFLTDPLEYKYRVTFVLVLGVILTLLKCSWIINSVIARASIEALRPTGFAVSEEKTESIIYMLGVHN